MSLYILPEEKAVLLKVKLEDLGYQVAFDKRNVSVVSDGGKIAVCIVYSDIDCPDLCMVHVVKSSLFRRRQLKNLYNTVEDLITEVGGIDYVEDHPEEEKIWNDGH